MENIGRKMVEIAENTVPSVTSREVYEKKEAGEPMVILDIREPDEWEKGVIEGGDLDYVIFYEKPFSKFERIIKTASASFISFFDIFNSYV